jgi:type 2 lantibiotic biosynthesis protein LanM
VSGRAGDAGPAAPAAWDAAEWYQALTLVERAAAAALPHAREGADLELARQRAARWRAQEPFASDEVWQRRLASDGLDEAAFLDLLAESPAALRERIAQPPAWLAAIARAFAAFPATAAAAQTTAAAGTAAAAKTRQTAGTDAAGTGAAGTAAPGTERAAAAGTPLPSAGAGDRTGFLHLLGPLLHDACARLRGIAERLAGGWAADEEPDGEMRADGRKAGEPRTGEPRADGARHHAPFTPDTALALLYPNLASRLLQQISRALVLELNVARLEERLDGATAEERFASFAAWLRRPEVAAELLRRYPVLARQAALTIEQWLATSGELLARLAADWREIRAVFSPGSEPGPLAAVRAGAGDAHRGGRTVTLLRFASGFRLVYKPKPLAVEAAFQGLLAWANAGGFAPALRTVRVLPRDGYGWAEHVASGACAGEPEVERFYQRQGGLLALLHVLDAADCHSENLIAAGEHPVLVDLEALFHPWIGNPEGGAGHGEDGRGEGGGGEGGGTGATPPAAPGGAAPVRPGALAGRRPLPEVPSPARSVLRIGLLPERSGATLDEPGVDLSGLGGGPGQSTPQPVLYVTAEGTDEMRFGRKRMPLPVAANLPTLAAGEVRLPRFADAIAAGFERMYRLLLARRDELLREDGPLAAFAGAEVRVLLRPTLAYQGLLTESFHPDVLGNALLRDQHLDHLWAALEHQPWLEPFLGDERRDLERGDVPIFTTRADSRDLWNGRGERLPGMLAATGLERVRDGLRALGPADLVLQAWTVRGCLAAVELAAGARRRPPYRLVPAAAPAGRQELLAAARSVADRLQALASREHDRTLWYGLAPAGGGAWQFSNLQADLYGGLPGIALFLAQLAAVTGEARYDELARGALAALLPLARPRGETDPPLRLVGAWTGWGGLIYAFAHLAALWHDPALLDAAEGCVAQLPGLIESDDTLDLMDGTAGCLAALLALHELRPAAATLGAAVRCGERLLARAEPQEQGLGWCNAPVFPQPLTGFSHGAAGVAWALLRLAAATGDGRFAAAARSGLAFERSLYRPALGNWADLREEEDQGAARDRLHASERLMCAWCHGAAGIGLSRLAMLPLLDDPGFHDEIAVAVATTLAEGLGLTHCLCHGDLGCLDFLLLAARHLGDGALADQVYRLAGGVLANVAADGWRFGMPAGAEPPGLMLGLAGIGYGFLRLACPDRVPAVLLLETRPGGALHPLDPLPPARGEGEAAAQLHLGPASVGGSADTSLPNT